jgi:hypothetical protein
MNRDDEMQQKRLRNYQLMFKTALACLALSLATTLFGGYRALAESEADLLVFGLLLVVMSVGSAYLTVDSTVRVLEGETHGA